MLSKVRDDGDAARSYIRFKAPSDMMGVQFVSISKKDGSGTEQFTYFPPPDEMFTRVSGAGRTGPFFGSDFSYEDMEVQQIEDAEHKLLGSETVTIGDETVTAWKIESTPKAGTDSGYGKLIVWIDQRNDVARQVLFFDKKDRELKRMQILTLIQDGTRWIPIDTLMEGLQRATRTTLHVDDYKINVPDAELPQSMFSEAYVKSQG